MPLEWRYRKINIIIILTSASTVSTRVLDLCFNRIRKVEGLENLTNLKKLYLVQNKLTAIENIGHLTELRMLELGSNRIRVRLPLHA